MKLPLERNSKTLLCECRQGEMSVGKGKNKGKTLMVVVKEQEPPLPEYD